MKNMVKMKTKVVEDPFSSDGVGDDVLEERASILCFDLHFNNTHTHTLISPLDTSQTSL